MGIYDKIRQEAKLDSRRFSKSIMCEIMAGDDLLMLYNAGIVPSGIYIKRDTGLDPINNKMFVMPIVKYEEYKKLFKGSNKEEVQITEKDTDTIDADAFSIHIDNLNKQISFLKQNVVLVQLDFNIPESRKGGLSPKIFGVLIDSIDIGQCTNAYYTSKTNENLRQKKDLRD
jgi:hypothetical protein